MKAVIYLRVSTKEQAEEGYSIPAQAQACRRFIADKGWGSPMSTSTEASLRAPPTGRSSRRCFAGLPRIRASAPS